MDLPALAEEVKEALALLETQTYIQRSGNVYEYLTNDEKLIEEEIKNVDIDSSEVSAQLFKILSGDVVKTNKIRYTKNGQDFPFGFKLDDQVHGPQKELSVHFITPEYPFAPEEIRMHSAGKDELRVVLEPDERVLSDLRLLIKTDKYTKRKQTTSLSAVEEQILRSKATQNREREKELVQRIQTSVGNSQLVVNAADIPVASQDALGRVTDGFQELINRTYTQLKLLGGVAYSELQVAGAANPESGLFDADAILKLNPPADEILSYVLRKDALGEQVTVKTIVDSFQSKPYGWDLASIEVMTAFLVGVSKLTLTTDGNVLKRSEVATALRNTQKHPHQVVSPQRTFDERKVATFRKFCTDFFDEGNAPKDPLELARHGADRLKSKLEELKATVTGSRYPFVEQLTSTIEMLAEVVDQPDDWYLSDFNCGEDLLEAKENLIDPIQSFLNGAQRVIYDDAATLLAQNAGNMAYISGGATDAVQSALADQDIFRGNKITQLKLEADSLGAQIEAALVSNRESVTQRIQLRKVELLGGIDFERASADAQQLVTEQVDATLLRLLNETQIGLIHQIGSTFETSDYPTMLDALAKSRPDAPGDPSPPKQTISVKTVAVTGVSGVLETEEDVDTYVGALRGALLDILNNGKRISL
jgi:hypothetical protein